MKIRKMLGSLVAAAMALTAFAGVSSTAQAAPAWQQEGVAWMAPAEGGVAVYRLRSASGLHHYTTDENERAYLTAHGWTDEGVAFHADESGANVYRVNNPVTRQHHYTLDANEKDYLSTHGWDYEGVAWHVNASASVPVYRAYNPSTREHLWLTDAHEYEVIGGAAASPKAIDVLDGLTINDTLASGYDRDLFGEAWADVDGNDCDTRDDILARDLTDVVRKDACKVASGTLHDPYTGTTIAFTRGGDSDHDGGIQIDHVVALSNAWKSGANTWTDAQRLSYANDPYVLLAVDDQANEDKRDHSADKWLPANTAYQCSYVARQIGIKSKYKLNVTNAEYRAMRNVLDTCPAQTVPAGVGAPVSPAPKPTPAPSPSPSPAPQPQQPAVQHGITPGAFCSPAGAKGIGKKNGVTYICKADNAGRLRWRR
ncbi:hypothetical protein BW13_11245 [Bifidobacterium sp. UTCIF-37]|uniref:GmrSD restriction endonuclease domain-containing protein n=1 Tax=Bifidobacterium sp. UTCIF-37 TaxID=1465259 RepID=UPI001C61358C|nr:DUF1524 domain-containing protein [Bifidobacterium sp. UTCIF-37]TPF85362.1 hypothetical protein BW13_11245 [Bifidobacterium sp. UTCIF-37]